MARTLTPSLREAMHDALVETISEGGTFAEGSALYLVELNATPDGAVIDAPHPLDDVLELWPSLLDEA